MPKLTEKETEKVIKELSDSKDEIVKLVKNYNKLAKKINLETRIGYALSEAFKEDILADEIEENVYSLSEKEREVILKKYNLNYEKHVKENGSNGNYVNINSPGADGWFPSSICQGY